MKEHIFPLTSIELEVRAEQEVKVKVELALEPLEGMEDGLLVR